MRSLLAAGAAAVASLVLVGPAQAQLDQLSPGPFQTATWDWNFGNLTVSNPNGGGNINVTHYGQMTYPVDSTAGAQPPIAATTEGFPLVVFGHGRFFQNGVWQTNHLQAAYLMERLASWGIVATSVNLGVVGQFGNPAGIPQRGEIFLATLERTLDVDNQAGTPPAGLQAAIDGTKLGLLGHSRGGEGAVAGAVLNLLQSSPLPILAVGTIAPTDFENYSLPADLPYMSLYGSKDGDVNNGWPIELHDQCESEERVFEYIHGANHFWFTESLVFTGEGNADISRALHHEIAMGYLAGFMVRKLTDNPLSSAVFCDGPEMAPVTSQAEILPRYRDPNRATLDDFETNSSTSLSSEGTVASASAFGYALESDLFQTQFTYYHRDQAFVGAWDVPGALWFTQVPPSVNTGSFSHLSLDFAQRVSTTLNPNGQEQDLSVGMVDANGQIALVRLSDFGAIRYPATHPGGGLFGPTFPQKSVLQTTRIPLSAFAAANPLFDLSNINFVGWTPDQTASGEVAFDDVEFTQ